MEYYAVIKNNAFKLPVSGPTCKKFGSHHSHLYNKEQKKCKTEYQQLLLDNSHHTRRSTTPQTRDR
jgi:hypothetical protein